MSMRKNRPQIAIALISLVAACGTVAAVNIRDKQETPQVERYVEVAYQAASTPKEIRMKDVVQTPAPIVPEATPAVEETPAPVELEPPTYTKDDLEALAIGIYQEAGGDACSDDTRQMVGEVILNRVASENFPDTIQEVLTAPYQYGRLHWTGLVWPERAAAPGEAHAVERAYKCAEDLLNGDVERLLPPDAVWQAEFEQGTEVISHQDGMFFCR